ncbi:hypothetical protein B0H11DRAFT_1900122 [Mycena galericulata]|nr:hypothetical protein B0H11DRAFT_1900122 [Mycena galericulata]
MKQQAHPLQLNPSFVFDLNTPLVAHGVELDFRILDNGLVTPPSYVVDDGGIRDTIVLGVLARVMEGHMIEAFQARFPYSPPHPDRAATTPTFRRAAARLAGQLACSNAVYFRLARVHREQHEASAAFASAVQDLATDDFLAASTVLSQHAVRSLGTAVPLIPYNAFQWLPDDVGVDSPEADDPTSWEGWPVADASTHVVADGAWGSGTSWNDYDWMANTGNWGGVIGWPRPHRSRRSSVRGNSAFFRRHAPDVHHTAYMDWLQRLARLPRPQEFFSHGLQALLALLLGRLFEKVAKIGQLLPPLREGDVAFLPHILDDAGIPWVEVHSRRVLAEEYFPALDLFRYIVVDVDPDWDQSVHVHAPFVKLGPAPS